VNNTSPSILEQAEFIIDNQDKLVGSETDPEWETLVDLAEHVRFTLIDLANYYMSLCDSITSKETTLAYTS
jgi:hypothetical protein